MKLTKYVRIVTERFRDEQNRYFTREVTGIFFPKVVWRWSSGPRFDKVVGERLTKKLESIYQNHQTN